MSRPVLPYLATVCLLAAFVALAFIWVPLLLHFHVAEYPISASAVKSARTAPTDSKIDSLRDLAREGGWWHEDEIVEVAEDLLGGSFSRPGRTPKDIALPFDAEIVERGSPSDQLFVAGLAVPRVFVEAYEESGRDDFLEAARDVILGWASYERSQFLPRGMLWNDHAVARRVRVLAHFWRHYRRHRSYDSGSAKTILDFVGRNSAMLAKPAHFTVSTNHGIMQNLALWHAVLAFPTLPMMQEYKALAFDRLEAQIEFYINDEGVILEHSAGYHLFGLRLLRSAFEYLDLLEYEIPRPWVAKYEEALEFAVQMRRPDGTLPMFGDTRAKMTVSKAKLRSLANIRPLLDTNARGGPLSLLPEAESLYPAAGYAIWWDGIENWPQPERLTQTMMAWSNYPGQGHKHADELSVLIWAGGRSWLTNVGYLGYGTSDRARAESWEGSNAPHIVGEEPDANRRSYATSSAALGGAAGLDLAAIDLQRDNTSGFQARRQIVYVAPGLWVIVDRVSGTGGRPAQSIWTSWHDVSVTSGQTPDSYTLSAANAGTKMDVKILGTSGMSSRTLTASRDPFAGWLAVRYKVTPAPAIVVQQLAGDSWAASLWSLTPSQFDVHQASMLRWDGLESWTLQIPRKGGAEPVNLSRSYSRLNWSGDDRSDGRYLDLVKPRDVTSTIEKTRTAYAESIAQYPGDFYPNLQLRKKITYLLIALFLCQELFSFFYRRRVRVGYTSLRLLAATTWVMGGFWLAAFYL